MNKMQLWLSRDLDGCSDTQYVLWTQKPTLVGKLWHGRDRTQGKRVIPAPDILLSTGSLVGITQKLNLKVSTTCQVRLAVMRQIPKKAKREKAKR